MKVLLVSQPGSDGVFRHVEGLADYLLGRGVTVHLAYSDRGACDQLHAFVARVAAAGGRTLNLRVGNGPEPADVAAWRGLRRLIRETAPDVVHAHSSKAGGLVRGLAMLGMKVPVLYTPNGYYRMHAPTGAKARFFLVLERLLGARGTTINVSLDEAAFARERLGIKAERQRVIHNVVDCARFRPAAAAEKIALRAEFDLPSDALILGTCGRFSAQKDPLTTYAALARIAEEDPRVFFLHLGKGELEPDVDALLAARGLGERCRRLPYLADTAPFYRVLDGFVLASLYEGLSYAALEALASNLPMILTRAPGNQDFETVGLDHVFWAPPGDEETLAAAMRAWRDRARNESETPNHRAVAMEQFSTETGYARLVAVYEECSLTRA